MIDAVVEPDELLDAALERAAQLARIPRSTFAPHARAAARRDAAADRRGGGGRSPRRARCGTRDEIRDSGARLPRAARRPMSADEREARVSRRDRRRPRRPRPARHRPGRVRHHGALHRRPAAPGGRPAGATSASACATRGAAVDIWEPAPGDVAGSRQIDAGLEFAGRPQLAATFAGAGGGRSLMLNGHIDVVTPAPESTAGRAIRGAPRSATATSTAAARAT